LINNSLKPIDLYFLTQHSKSESIEIMAIVLCELLSNRILEVEYKYFNQRLAPFEFKKGINFLEKKLRPIDKVFTNFFEEQKRSSIEANQFFYQAFVQAPSKADLVRLGIKSENLNKLLSFKKFFSVFGIIKLSKLGKIKLNKINQELNFLKSKLDSEINKKDPDQNLILNLLKERFFYLQEYKIDNIFGSHYSKYLEDFKSNEYDIQHELNFAFFAHTLKYAHIEFLKIEQLGMQYEQQKYEDDLSDFD